VRSRRRKNCSLYERAASAGGELAFAMWSKTTRRPVDTFAVLAAVAASLIIIVNAVFLQAGAHPAPFFAPLKSAPVAVNLPPKPAESAPPVHQIVTAPVAQPAAPRRNDPIADLIGPSPRIAAVQRALSEYGYGQIKPSGVLDQPTSEAIEKFERDKKLPVTGRVSDRLVNELSTMIGHPVE
jgi:Putative peptidoglycan binding domain